VSLVATPGVTRLYVAGALAPESQAGVEGGLDVLLGRRLGLHVTRFDQRASGLVQPVLLGADTLVGRTRSGALARTARFVYQMQNVGEIANRGWEMQGTAAVGRLALAGTLSLVDSRVVRLAAGYDGDLRPGDRMLEVPARTTSVSATWRAPRWSTSWTLARAADWTAYDRLALDSAAAGRPPGAASLSGAWLRGFWRDYDGVTRLRASISRDLFRGAELTLTGDNLLDQRTGEPDNATVLAGRTVTLGARVRF
jgi:iron complex outermembrane receptor protein